MINAPSGALWRVLIRLFPTFDLWEPALKGWKALIWSYNPEITAASASMSERDLQFALGAETIYALQLCSPKLIAPACESASGRCTHTLVTQSLVLA